jgi:glutathione S-transferase
MSFTLYDYVLSGNCYKIRLMASLLGVEYERVAVDYFPGAAHRGPEMLALNPAGTLPVLTAGDMVLTETAAMLVWLAATHDESGRWAPAGDAARMAEIVEWMGVGGTLTGSVGAARAEAMLQIPCNRAAAERRAETQFRRIEARLSEQRLAGSDWLVGDGPTIADIACFPYTALAPDAGIEHDARPAIRNWLYAVRSLPGFLTMPGVHAMHELREGPADG